MSTSLAPKGYTRRRHPRGEFMAWEGAVDHIASILEGTTLYEWAKSREDRLDLLGRSLVPSVRAPLPGPEARTRWAVRHYLRGGAVATQLGDLYLRIGRPRPFREITAIETARARGVRTPAAVGGVTYSCGAAYRCDLITEIIPDVRTLADLLLDQKDLARSLNDLARAGDLISALDDAGVYHVDLNAHNILLPEKSDEPAWVVDFDRARVAEPGSRSFTASMKHRLVRSILKIGAPIGRECGRRELVNVIPTNKSAPASTLRETTKEGPAVPKATGAIIPGMGWQGPPPKEVCIVMLSAIGDAVHVLPVATALKRAWPETKITWVIQPVPLRMVQNHPAIDEFIVFHRRRGLSAWMGVYDLIKQMRGRQFDLLLGLQVYLKAGLATALAPARVKLGFDLPRARDGQWLFTNVRIPSRGHRHVQDQYLEFLEYLGINPTPVEWGLQFSEEERVLQADFFQEIQRPVCAVVIATSKVEKNWHVEGYARVLEALEREHGLQPVLLGGPSTIERKMANEILKETDAQVIDQLGDNLRRLMWIIDNAKLVISPDTGPLHISRALGTPVVALFGHTNPKRSGPWQAFEDLIVDGYAEYPGEQYPLTPKYREGMKRITVDDVLEKVAIAADLCIDS